MKDTKQSHNWGLRALGVAVGTLALSAMLVPAANAETEQATDAPITDSPVSGTLDPSTFEGPVLIATESGEYLTYVNSGELINTAQSVRNDVAKGVEPAGATTDAAARATCGTWHNAVAGPSVWWTSVDGCAVFGYPGYVRYYSWENMSDVSACVQGKGWNSSGAATWTSLGCTDNADVAVAWGNVLAYTQVKGVSISTVTGAAYQWFS